MFLTRQRWKIKVKNHYWKSRPQIEVNSLVAFYAPHYVVFSLKLFVKSLLRFILQACFWTDKLFECFKMLANYHKIWNITYENIKRIWMKIRFIFTETLQLAL